LANDKTVVPTIRLLDPAVVNETFTQYQQIRSFYDFPEKMDIDRYMINGQLQDFVVGVREINYLKLTGQQTNWQNKHTVFTHGYGFVGAPANTICDGAPFFVSGLIASPGQNGDNSSKCVAASDTIPVTEPRIYYGELAGADDYVVVGKRDGAPDPEFDRPAGDSEQQYSYTGKGGVPVGSTFRKILYGLHFWEANFLLSDVFNDNSKLIYIRNPRDRVERVAPFLTMDGDPYPAVVNGRVTWILDGYTTSATYPYSQRVDLRGAVQDATSDRGTVLQAKQNINYIRNSVKATVDAYDGTVTLYTFDDNDPILKAWNQAFGGNLIKPKSAISPELAAHFRYPEDLFKVQRDLLSKFHVNDPRQFNSGQDFWAVPDDPAQTGTQAPKQPPYYLLTQFPGSQTSRFQLTAALTPNQRQNLAALVSGVLTDQGPKLELLELPREGRIPGPGQAYQNMVNDNDARQRITLLGQGSSQVVYGNLLSLPYGGGLLYVQPVYLKSTNVANPYPLMRLVMVSYGTTVSFGQTLDEAIKGLVAKGEAGGATPPNQQPGETANNQPTTGATPLSPELAAAATKLSQAITKVQTAQASGDFTAYGQALSELQTAMNDFLAAQSRATGSTASPSSSPSPGGG
jgi:uncharacterized protein